MTIAIAGLHGHNEYSLLDGAGTAVQHAEAAGEAGYAALAETNHATLAGALHHMRACREAGVLPITGCEIYWRPNRKVQGQKEWLKQYNHLTILADGHNGWRSLTRLVSESHRSGFYGRAAADDELLEKHAEGLVCLTGCLGGRLAERIVAQDDRGAEAWIRQLQRIFGDRLFVEVMPHDIPEQRIANVEAVRLADKYGIGVVTTVDAHYPRQEWAGTQDVLLMIATNQSLAKREAKREAGEDVYKFDVQTLYHMTAEEILELYVRHHPDLSYDVVRRSIDDTLQVAAMCRPFLVDKTEKMPVVSFPGESDNEALLRRLTYEGLAKRGYGDDSAYRERVELELKTFVKLKAVEQMLMAWDVVDWAKSDRPIPTRARKTGELVFDGSKKPIMVGPSRGSAGGSAASWALGITNINPMKYRLLFERFLNPSRVGKPDIDLDFPPERVDEVESYVKVIYGEDRVVDIVAHSTFGPRSALSDAGRVLNVPYAHVKAATKTICDKAEGNLEDIRLLNPAVDKLASENLEMWSHACRIQGSVARKCVSGDTIIKSARPGGEDRTIAEIFSRKPSLRWKKIKGMVDDGMLGWVDVEAYHDVGELDVYRLSTRKKSIKASAEHRFLTRDGWKMLSELDVGDEVAVNGKKVRSDKGKKRGGCEPGCSCGRHKSRAGRSVNQPKCLPGCTCKRHKKCPPGCTCSRHIGQRKAGDVPWNKGTVGLVDAWNKGLSRETSEAVARQGDKMVGNKNGSGRAGKIYAPESVNTFRKRLIARDGLVCQRCGIEDVQHRMHAHHIVPRRLGGTHETSNGIMICAACHPAEDGHRGITGDQSWWVLREEIDWEEIELIDPAGRERCYDLTIATHHNYVANGFLTHNSEHAGGLLILPGPAEEYIPVERKGGQKGKLLSAFGERSGKGNALISDYGYNKLDVLRVAELTKQQLAVDLYEERTGERIVLDDLPVHDDPYACEPEVMKGFHDGYLIGIFQFSATAAKLTRQVKPDNIFDLAAINALIRPGPRGAGLDQQYARRKNGEEQTTYWHPTMEPILDFSYGVVAFQESLQEVVHHLGGLSRADADIFRKIASKLYRDPVYAREVMGEWEIPVKRGFAEHGLTQQESDHVWGNVIKSFADYSFNLSHAGGYSLLAYRDMWLKIHITREFYAALLSKGLSKVTKKRIAQKAEAVREARHRGLRILPPDVNESGRSYTVVEGGIRLGLEAIKHIGPAASAAIEKYRPFSSYEDIEARVPPKHLKVTSRAALVMSGACDAWGKRDRFTEDHIDELERELLGMSLTSTHSIAAFADVIEGRFWTEDEFDAAEEGQRVTVVGEVVAVKDHIDKNGNLMCFVDLAYGPNRWSLTVFASLYEDYGELLHSRRPILATGSKSTHKGRSGIRVESLPSSSPEEWVAPLLDLESFVEMAVGAGDDAEVDTMDSMFPEDLGLETDEPVLI